MCGRFTLKAKPEAVAAAFGLPSLPLLEPRYNVAPTQTVAAVRLDRDTGSRRLDLLRWGLVPGWADDPAIGNRMINARAETVAVKPAYRHAFKARRCLVVADGFFEWQKRGGRKQPYHIRLTDDRPFAFAGLWEHWERETGVVDSCALITTEPNELVRPIHERMPAILRREDYDRWLDPAVTDPAVLSAMLGPYPAAEMVAVPVSTLVNAPAHDQPECVHPAHPL
jgi:putative SOS response-associated peptidase YedK